jgi:hypothetical protein
MKKIKLTGIIILIKGICLIALGIFHILAIFIFQQDDVKNQVSIVI